MYWKVFKGYNDPRVLSLKTTNKVNEEDKDKAYEIILHGNETSMNE